MTHHPSRSVSRSPVWGSLLLLAAFNVIVSAPAQAQVIRGTVAERQTGLPVAGALVTIGRDASGLELSSSTLRTVTDSDGRFAIAPGGPGTYRLTIRRIGLQPHVVPIRVGVGETRSVTIHVDRVTQALPAIAVSDSTMCVSRGAQAGRVAALWEAARTALYVMVGGDTGAAPGRRLVRFTRIRDVNTFAVEEEEFHSYDERDGLSEPRFTSVSADSLSRYGFWRAAGGDTEFHAPDAHVLLSSAFLRDHCFGVSDGEGEQAGRVGLTFEPVRDRRVPDVTGVLWLDATTHELRMIQAEWTMLPDVARHDRLGAELHFLRLPSGEWLVRRWSITMPRVTTRTIAVGPLRDRYRRETRLEHLIEEGGVLYLPGLATGERPGTVTGEVIYNHRPLLGARVRLVGTPFSSTVDSSGRFRFDSVPAGPHAVVVRHERYDALYLRAVEQEFLLDEGTTRHLKLVAPSDRAIGNHYCPGRNFRWATLRASVVDRLTLKPLPNVSMRLEWLEMFTERVEYGLTGMGSFRPVIVQRMRDIGRETTTNELGIATFCNVAPARELTLRLLGYDFELPPLGTFRLGPQENGAATVRLTLPKAS